jgi:C-terminal processing protease CtpA/Prc
MKIFTNYLTQNKRDDSSNVKKRWKRREVPLRHKQLEAAFIRGMGQNRKKLVDKFSNGRLGYIHIQGMSMPSFEEFERELTAAGYGKEGLVVEFVTTGGSTTIILMTILNYKQHAYTIPRGASDNLELDKKKFRALSMASDLYLQLG